MVSFRGHADKWLVLKYIFLAGHADKLFYHIEFANGVQPVSAALGKYSGPCFNVSLIAAGSDFSHVVDDFPLSGV